MTPDPYADLVESFDASAADLRLVVRCIALAAVCIIVAGLILAGVL